MLRRGHALDGGVWTSDAQGGLLSWSRRDLLGNVERVFFPKLAFVCHIRKYSSKTTVVELNKYTALYFLNLSLFPLWGAQRDRDTVLIS